MFLARTRGGHPPVTADPGVRYCFATPRRHVLDAASRNADVAQLVAHHLAKVRVAGSSPVVRSTAAAPRSWAGLTGGNLGMPGPRNTAEWPSGSGKGLQSPVRGFDSR